MLTVSRAMNFSLHMMAAICFLFFLKIPLFTKNDLEENNFPIESTNDSVNFVKLKRKKNAVWG